MTTGGQQETCSVENGRHSQKLRDSLNSSLDQSQQDKNITLNKYTAPNFIFEEDDEKRESEAASENAQDDINEDEAVV